MSQIPASTSLARTDASHATARGMTKSYNPQYDSWIFIFNIHIFIYRSAMYFLSTNRLGGN